MKHDEYNRGKIKSMVQVIAGIVARNPEHATNTDYIMACVYTAMPELRDKTRCPNCEASMAQYLRTVDYHQAKLLRAMGRKVDEHRQAGLSFTDANKVHVQKELDVDFATMGCTAITRQLGLIAKVLTKSGAHDTKKGWVVTSRGWDFLKNQPIPKQVVVFRNKIIDRTEETTTIQEILHGHNDQDYDQNEWYTIAGYQQGKLVDTEVVPTKRYPD